MQSPLSYPQYVPTEEVRTVGPSITRPWVTRYPGHLERQVINPAILPGVWQANDLRALSASPVTRHKSNGQKIAQSAPPPRVAQYGQKYVGLRAPRWAEGAYGTGAGGVTDKVSGDAARTYNAPNALAAIASVSAAARAGGRRR